MAVYSFFTASLTASGVGAAGPSLSAGEVYGCAFAPGAALLCTVSFDNTARLWAPAGEGAPWAELQVLAGHSGLVLGRRLPPPLPSPPGGLGPGRLSRGGPPRKEPPGGSPRHGREDPLHLLWALAAFS